jgi:DNA-binding transcriptional regulator YhcF (GntR family)
MQDPQETLHSMTVVDIIEQKLLVELKKGSYKPGDRTLSKRKLGYKLQTSPSNICIAISNLVKKGILETRPGSGTYIGVKFKEIISDWQPITSESIPRGICAFLNNSSYETIEEFIDLAELILVDHNQNISPQKSRHWFIFKSNAHETQKNNSGLPENRINLKNKPQNHANSNLQTFHELTVSLNTETTNYFLETQSSNKMN